ncbi:MAG TPA: 50S ribosomal protein L29 [Thermoanaerobaculia bacterium]|nr:50S ribosomal protein L29 [Thermoanaerobaculia bacterium]
MKASEFRNLTVEELQAKERDLADQLFNLRINKATGKLENPAKIPAVKRDLARVLTVLGEKQRAS